jgi:BCD family chlorophyll transporter-like MFS transporter
MGRIRKRAVLGFTFFMILMFQIASGFSAGIVTGILDPVMINELGVPALLVGLLLGSHYIIEPIRSYVGSLSDRYSIFKLHRAPFILLGGLILAASYPMILFAVEQLRDPDYHHTFGEAVSTHNYDANVLWIVFALLAFFVNGTGISIMGTAALAALVDTTSERVRGILASIGWTLLIAGIIIASIVSRLILPDTEGISFDYKTLYPIFMIVIPAVLTGLALLSSIGSFLLEPRREGAIDHKRTHVNFRVAFKVVSRIKQARAFLLFLFVYCTFMFMRDILAPAYAGNVFRMTVAERSALQATINGPILVAMIGAGVATLWISKKWSIYGGLGLAVVGMTVQAISGFTYKVDQAATQAYEAASRAFASKTISEAEYQAARAVWNELIAGNKGIFTIGLLLMGLGLGASVPGLIGTMMDITDRANAALYIGIWGIAQALGTGLANLGAGLMRDIAFNTFTGNLGVGYGFVFSVQALGSLISILLFMRINVVEFKRELEEISSSLPSEPVPLKTGAGGGLVS